MLDDIGSRPPDYGGNGNGGEDERDSLVGRVLVQPDGSQWVIEREMAPGVRLPGGMGREVLPTYFARNLDTDERQPFEMGSGTWWTTDRKEVTTNERGQILAERTIAKSDWDKAFGSGGGAGGGGAGGGGAAPRTLFPEELENIRASTAKMLAEIENMGLTPEEKAYYDARIREIDAAIANAGRVAPDPLGAANALLQQYSAQIAAGQLSADQAWNAFQQQFKEWEAGHETQKLELEKRIKTEHYALEREVSEASRLLRTQEERGQRAKTIVQDILPSSMPGLTGLNLPMLGRVPVSQVNLSDLFGPSGGPPISQTPAGDIGGAPIGPAPSFDPLPQQTPPVAPDIREMIAAMLRGSPGFNA